MVLTAEFRPKNGPDNTGKSQITPRQSAGGQLLRTGQITQASRDQGADLVITMGSREIVTQAKQYQDPIGNSAVQQVHGALPYYGATKVWVVTTSAFSKDAIDLAYITGVRLVSGNQLLNLFMHGQLNFSP